MKSTNTFGVYFIARPIKTNPNEALIYVRITVNKKRMEISVKKKVPIKNWDVKGGYIKGNKRLAQQT